MVTSEKKLAGFLSAAVIALFVAINAGSLGAGSLRMYDEFATLDRSYSFHKRGEYSVVHTDNMPTVRKPPLQYWMSAALMNVGVSPLFSVRFPSFLFATLLVLCAGWLTYLLFPQQPLAAAASVALMACNARLLENAKIAMLDVGMALFSTAAMIGCILAIQNPRWWYFVATACGLGVLQKAPVALIMVVIAVLTLWAARKFRAPGMEGLVFGRHFWLAALLMSGVVLAWPVMQLVLVGFDSLMEVFHVEIVQRFSPIADVDRSRAAWHSYILHQDKIFRIPAIIAMCALPFVLRRWELLIFVLLLGLYAVMVGFAKGQVFPRYSIVFLPFLAASLAICIFHLPWKPWLAAAIVLFFCVQNIFILERQPFEPDLQRVALAQKFAPVAGEGSIVLCDWTAGKSSRIDTRVTPGMFSVYASGGRPFFAFASPADFGRSYSSGRIGPKLQGFCTPEQLKAIESHVPQLTIVDEYGPYVRWRSG